MCFFTSTIRTQLFICGLSLACIRSIALKRLCISATSVSKPSWFVILLVFFQLLNLVVSFKCHIWHCTLRHTVHFGVYLLWFMCIWHRKFNPISKSAHLSSSHVNQRHCAWFNSIAGTSSIVVSIWHGHLFVCAWCCLFLSLRLTLKFAHNVLNIIQSCWSSFNACDS